jgi:hypothetical protein
MLCLISGSIIKTSFYLDALVDQTKALPSETAIRQLETEVNQSNPTKNGRNYQKVCWMISRLAQP